MIESRSRVNTYWQYRTLSNVAPIPYKLLTDLSLSARRVQASRGEKGSLAPEQLREVCRLYQEETRSSINKTQTSSHAAIPFTFFFFLFPLTVRETIFNYPIRMVYYIASLIPGINRPTANLY